MANTYTNLSQYQQKLVWDHLGCQMLFSLIKCYFLLFISRLEEGTLGSIFEPKLAPIDPNMEVALVKDDLRNIFGLWRGWDRSQEARATV